MKKHKISLHIFRRDLRLNDNTALIYAMKNSEKVIPCLVLDKRHLEDNEYRSDNAIEFMEGCLKSLDKEIRNAGCRLYIFCGEPEEAVEFAAKNAGISMVSMNRGYTPFSKMRDEKIEAVCKFLGIEFSYHADALLNEPESVLKDDLKPYTIFTHFFRKAKNIPVREPEKNIHGNFYAEDVPGFSGIESINTLSKKINPHILLQGGREEGLKLLEKIEQLSGYEKDRNYPAKNATTHLSAHLKFGSISPREAFFRIKSLFGESHTLISELYWRDFFTQIAYNFPFVFGNSFRKEYDKIGWSQSEKDFNAWKTGITGFPIVDAGMRELNATGLMHNRVRMITASFLVKDLHIDWKRGEKYFAQKLIDYDPCVNNGNWQWAASTGCDSQPYFRIFNPWLQQKKFDPECEYIKKWVPELSNISPKEIHRLENEIPKTNVSYPRPMVSHKEESLKSRAMFASLKK